MTPNQFHLLASVLPKHSISAENLVKKPCFYTSPNFCFILAAMSQDRCFIDSKILSLRDPEKQLFMVFILNRHLDWSILKQATSSHIRQSSQYSISIRSSKKPPAVNASWVKEHWTSSCGKGNGNWHNDVVHVVLSSLTCILLMERFFEIFKEPSLNYWGLDRCWYNCAGCASPSRLHVTWLGKCMD